MIRSNRNNKISQSLMLLKLMNWKKFFRRE